MKLIKLLIFILILAILAVSFIPLDLYYSKVAKTIKPLKLENISGSAVKGSAEHLNYYGMDLGQVKWLVYPSSYNAATIDFKLRSKDYDIRGKYTKKPHAEIVKGLKGTLDWSVIDNKINFSHGKISGYIQLDFDHLEFRDQIPARITGKAVTKELRLLKPIKKELGEIEVVFVSDNPEIIVGQVNSTSTVLNVSGAIYIHKNRRWEVKLTLLPLPGEYEIEYALQSIGDRRRGGGRSLNLAGFY